jgi:hypothetical protein
VLRKFAAITANSPLFKRHGNVLPVIGIIASIALIVVLKVVLKVEYLIGTVGLQ